MNNVNSWLTTFLLFLPICLMPFTGQTKPVDDKVILYTPYTSRSVTPGTNLTYNIEVINRTSEVRDITFSVRGLPDNWNPSLSAGATTIQQLSIKPQTFESGHTKEMDLSLNIPLKIDKGSYHFRLVGRTENGQTLALPLTIRVTEQGIFKTELQVDQANMEGYADSDFNYNVILNNRTAQKQNYALSADAPAGWDVRFRVGGDYVTSVDVGSNESKNISVKVTSPQRVEANTYKINIQATSGNTSDEATLETAIKGRYSLNLSTPSGRLSSNITAGESKDIKLSLENTGTVSLSEIDLSATSPTDWNVTFDTKTIDELKPGATRTVNATIQASSKAIAGDYQLNIKANTTDASSDASFRITVDKPITWGSIGIFIILLVVGGIGYLFKKYGRR